ncbi:MAG TPA: hypothetical protein VG096_06880 [Bryobacteraceae bacterium]|jgi:hypothetical protein|nr:hypothetical protein [Bryobacteraceae bacterium]
MWRSLLLTIAALPFASVLAHAQHIYFTTLIPPTCPIVIENLTPSKDFGFQSAVFHNDSSQTVESLHLRVTLSSAGKQEQIVDSGHIYITLEPGEQKSQDVFLGRMQSLNQRAKFDHLEVARAMISVESVEYTDGSRWYADGPLVYDPIEPVRPLPPK